MKEMNSSDAFGRPVTTKLFAPYSPLDVRGSRGELRDFFKLAAHQAKKVEFYSKDRTHNEKFPIFAVRKWL